MRRHQNHGHSRRRGVFQRLAWAFRTRQIYLRSEGDVWFITLGPFKQLVLLCLLLGSLFWTAYATVNVAFKDQLLAMKERRMAETRLAYEDKVAELRRAMDAINTRLMLDQNAYLAKVDGVRDEYLGLVRQHRRLVEFFKQGWFPLRDAGIGAPPQRSGAAEPHFTQKYAALFDTPAAATRPLGDVRSLFEPFTAAQLDLLDGVAAHAVGRIAGGVKLFSDLGLDARQAVPLDAATADATGGPLIPASFTTARADPLEDAMSGIARQFALFERLKESAAALPIAVPLARFDKVSSGYGFRADPFRRGMAMHQGTDFKAPFAEPILATAGGVVLRAGWDGSYGKLVEIAHDNGVTTRYAHMSSVSVSPGQRVKRGDMVGRLGSTGRSTGPHLHYETRINGQAIDPARFWRTRDDLQSLQKE